MHGRGAACLAGWLQCRTAGCSAERFGQVFAETCCRSLRGVTFSTRRKSPKTRTGRGCFDSPSPCQPSPATTKVGLGPLLIPPRGGANFYHQRDSGRHCFGAFGHGCGSDRKANEKIKIFAPPYGGAKCKYSFGGGKNILKTNQNI